MSKRIKEFPPFVKRVEGKGLNTWTVVSRIELRTRWRGKHMGFAELRIASVMGIPLVYLVATTYHLLGID